jgi:hypothetical protein
MSPLAKVFVVVNLILSLCFFGSSVALFATRENWRDTAEKFKKAADDELKKLEGKYADQGARLVKIHQERNTAVTNHASSLTEKMKLMVDLTKVQGDLTTANHRIETEVKEKTALTGRLQDLEKKNAEMNALVDAKGKEAEDAKAKMEKAINDWTRLRVDLEREMEAKNAARIELASIKDKADTMQLQLDYVKKLGTIALDGPLAPPIPATIQAVEPDKKLVVLSVGTNQKVKEGYEFTVYRGAKFVGKVKVVKVYEDLAGARILYTNDNEMVQVGDSANTQI